MSDESDDPSPTEDDAANDRPDRPGDADERAAGTSGEAGDPGDGPDGDPGRGGPDRDGNGDRGGPDGGGNGGHGGVDPDRVRALAEELAATREALSGLESRVDEKTVHRDDVTAELKRYVRARQRRGHATGWGPYLVLLYGTAMSLGAFYYLGGWVVIAALLVVWLSTLGLFVVMLFAGALIGAGRKLGGAREVVGKLRR